MRSPLLAFIAASFLLILTTCRSLAAIAEPYIPASPDTVLQRVPRTSDPRVRRFDELRAALAAKPNAKGEALKLALAYIDYGRSTGDARYLGRALAVIEPWLKHQPVAVDVMLVQATILQSRHHFVASRRELGSILERDPGNVQAWLTLASVAMVQADYPTANRSCVKVAIYGGDFMGTMCSAQLRALTGQSQQAYRLLGLIEHSGPKVPLDVKAYVEGLMADSAKRVGMIQEAESHFRRGLQLAPGDNFLLADYADFLLDQGRPRDVIDLVQDYTQSDTSFLRLVLAQSALGDADATANMNKMQARFAAMDQRGSHVYRREQARFALALQHDPARALALAEQNWTVQREPKDMRVFLQAAMAAGNPAAAKPVLDLLAHSHLQDPTIDYLANQANAALRNSTVSTGDPGL